MRKISVGKAGIVVAAIVLISLSATGQNAVTNWNDIGITQAVVSTTPGASGAAGTSVVAKVQLAVYNAVNAVDPRYRPYKYSVSAPQGASTEAAAVEAAYRMLLYLLPDRAAALTAQYNASMSAIPDGQAKLDGQALGQASVNEMIALRMGDGWGGPWPYSYPSSPVPGVWTLTPGTSAPVTPWLGQLRPFTFDGPDQFLPDEPPPDIGSQTWADDYNQVKTLGSINSAVRTPTQTEIGMFWTDYSAAQYGRMLRAMAVQEDLDLLDSARLLAMGYAALADGYIGCWNAKYHFSFWRPVTAIRNGDIDGNPETVADPTWTPLAKTPGHPEYPAAHGCITGALADTLQAYFGTPNIPIVVNSTVTGTTHYFTSIRDWQREVEWARVYGGMHYHHSLVQGFVLGHKVAHNLVNNYFQPVK